MTIEGVATSSKSGGLLMKAFSAGEIDPISWTEVTVGDLIVTVASDALKATVNGQAGVRLPVSHAESVAICRELDSVVPNQAIADAMFAQASAQLSLVALVRTASDSMKMSTVGFTLRFHDGVEKQLAAIKTEPGALACGAWKYWLLHARLAERGAVNYGFWNKYVKPPRPVQTVGGRHDAAHYDYSQLLQPIKRTARHKVTGERVDLLDYMAKHDRIPTKFLDVFRTELGPLPQSFDEDPYDDTDLLSVLTLSGVEVEAHPGWEKKGRAGFHPEGIMVHHTAGPKKGDAPSLPVCIQGRPGLSGPLCHIFLSRSGKAHLLAANITNHAGKGAKEVLDQVRRGEGPRGNAQDHKYADTVFGNEFFYGIEVENSGTAGDPYSDAQIEALTNICAAICQAHKWSASRVIHHRQWTARKIDMSFRGDLPGLVAQKMDAGAITFDLEAEATEPMWEPEPLPPELPRVLILHVSPNEGISLRDTERALIKIAGDFTLQARPELSPLLFTHHVLRSDDSRLLWTIAFEGIELPDGETEERESLVRAILEEADARLIDLAQVASITVCADLAIPPPDRGFSAAEGGAVSFGEDALPGWEAYATDSGAPEAAKPLPADLRGQIAQQRAAIKAEPALSAHGKGHMYTGHTDKAHRAYVESYLRDRAERANASDRRKILAFLALQPREGSTSAINTYDNQIVTWGTGWGGLGWLGSVMMRAVANEAVREAFGRSGLRYRGKNVYDVVDLKTGKVITGRREALEVIRRSPELLYLLIDVARRPETRDAVTLAQLETFMIGSGKIEGEAAIHSQALFNLIAHLQHWAPGYIAGFIPWALPRVSGEASAERDKKLAVLAGQYFYGKARKYKWIPTWKQFQLYFRHLKDDGLDCLHEPFILATAPPEGDPFADAQSVFNSAPTKAGRVDRALKNPPLAGRPDLETIAATGRGALRKGQRSDGVKALQEALLHLGVELAGGADGVFGPSLAAVVMAFQKEERLIADGIVGRRTLFALDAALGHMDGAKNLAAT